MLSPPLPPPPLWGSESAHTSHLPVLSLVVLVLLTSLVFTSTISYSPQFQNFLATIHTIRELRSYWEVVQYLEWREAMAEEFWMSQQSSTWDIVSRSSVFNLWVANRSSRSNIDLMVPLSGTMLALLLEDLLRSMGLITIRLLHVLLRWLQFVLYWQWLQFDIGHYIRWI